jgi:hypothetical protein
MQNATLFKDILNIGGCVMTSRTVRRVFGPLAVAAGVLAASLVAAAPGPQTDAQKSPAVRASDRRSGFGNPESITGTISVVKPDEGLLIVVNQGAGHSTNVSGAAVVTQNPNGSAATTDTDVSAAPAPAATKYEFRVTAHTLIRVNGQRATLRDLGGMQDKQVTVHFVPERNGNFAEGIEVGS